MVAGRRPLDGAGALEGQNKAQLDRGSERLERGQVRGRLRAWGTRGHGRTEWWHCLRSPEGVAGHLEKLSGTQQPWTVTRVYPEGLTMNLDDIIFNPAPKPPDCLLKKLILVHGS